MARDVALLMIGTNDVLREPNAASTVPGEVVSIVNQIHSVNPETHVLVAQLTPLSANTSFGAGVVGVRAATNVGITNAVHQLEAQGHAISLVDTSSITQADLIDGIHLTPAGYPEVRDHLVRCDPGRGSAPGRRGGAHRLHRLSLHTAYRLDSRPALAGAAAPRMIRYHPNGRWWCAHPLRDVVAGSRRRFPPRPTTASEVRALYQRFAAAQNARDLEQVRPLLLDSPTFLWVSDGQSFWGRMRCWRGWPPSRMPRSGGSSPTLTMRWPSR